MKHRCTNAGNAWKSTGALGKYSPVPPKAIRCLKIEAMLRFAPRGEVDPSQKENYSPHLLGAPKLLCPKSGSVLYKPKCQGYWGDRKCNKMKEVYLSQREEQEFAKELFLSIQVLLSASHDMHIMLGSHFTDKKFKIGAIIWFTQSQIASEGRVGQDPKAATAGHYTAWLATHSKQPHFGYLSRMNLPFSFLFFLFLIFRRPLNIFPGWRWEGSR